MSEQKSRKRQDLIARQIDEDLVLMDSAARSVHVLNRTARLVWDLCDGGHSAEEIARQLQDRFAVPPGSDPAADVREILGVFQDKGLLTDFPFPGE